MTICEFTKMNLKYLDFLISLSDMYYIYGTNIVVLCYVIKKITNMIILLFCYIYYFNWCINYLSIMKFRYHFSKIYMRNN